MTPAEVPASCPLPEVLARAGGPHGESVLRRRGEVFELIVDGVFAMDTAQTSTEVALAHLAVTRLAVRPVPDGGWRVALGGLGLGFTLGALLADPRVGQVDVMELDPSLPRWLAAGLVPAAAGLLADPRVRLLAGDVADLLPALARAGDRHDAVILDVDNGPGFLVHRRNGGIYAAPFLSAALAALRPGGALAIWSADPSPALLRRLRRTGSDVVEHRLPVERDGRAFEYAVYVAGPPLTGGAAGQ